MKEGRACHISLTNLLRKAYRSRPVVELDPTWQADVMRGVRTLADRSADKCADFDQFVWRLAPSVCALILIIGVCLVRMDFIPGYELASMFYENPVNYMWMQSFGLM